MQKKENHKMGRPRKRKATANWRIEVDSSADTKVSKITFYFPQIDHTYAKGIFYFPEISISSAVNSAVKKKLNKKGALTSCNAQNTKTVNGVVNGAINGRTIMPTGLSQGKKIQKEVRSKQLTDYFPVRRSVRKTSVTIKKEKQQEIEERILSGREGGYEVRDFMGKGRGVVSIHPVKKGEFVLEYSGDLISVDEAKRREYVYSHDENIGCYMYYFTHKNRQYCVDATRETGRLGRLVNHSKKGNLKTKSVLVEDVPRLILVAERDILPGEELLYDYGDRSKRSLESHPWLAL